jgi:hypothetical protein
MTMALADPQSVNIGGAISLPSVAGGGPNSTVYTSADGTVSMTVNQSIGKDTINTMVRVDKTVIAADPISTANKSLTGSVWFVFKFPIKNFGFSEADKIAIYTGLSGQLTASTNAVLKQILAAQH